MAKKDKKAKGKKGSGAADTVEAVRSAVERALPEGSKERGSQIVDEIARAVTRVRESLEEHKVLDDLKGLSNEIEGLARRVAALEKPSAPAGSASRSTAARKPAARKSASSRTTTRKAASSRSTTTRKPAASRSTAAKKSASSRKAASTRKASSSRKAASTRKASSTRKAASTRKPASSRTPRSGSSS